MNKHLSIKPALAVVVAVAAVGGASIAAASSVSAVPATGGGPRVAALTAGAADALPASVAEQLRGGDPAQRGADPARARTVRAGTVSWYLVPTDDGACLVTEDRTVTCASTDNINAGTLVSIEVTRSAQGGASATPSAVFRGVAPDGVAGATVLDAAGRTVATGKVSGNAYRVDVPQLAAGAKLQLADSGGAAVAETALDG